MTDGLKICRALQQKLFGLALRTGIVRLKIQHGLKQHCDPQAALRIIIVSFRLVVVQFVKAVRYSR